MNPSIRIGNRTLSNYHTSICVPIVSNTDVTIQSEAQKIYALQPDVVEWRADYYNDATDIQKIQQCLQMLRDVLKEIPILFTLRMVEEGGMHIIHQPQRLEMIKQVIEWQMVDAVDIEFQNGQAFVAEVVQHAQKYQVKTVLSNHNFEQTPSTKAIKTQLRHMQRLECDIVKVAYMPQNAQDVIRLVDEVDQFIQETQQLVIAISMGGRGLVTRVGANTFGSCVTFASGVNASAPGQVPIELLRQIMGYGL